MGAGESRLERKVWFSEVRNKFWKLLWLCWFRTNGAEMLRNKCVDVCVSK
jgi:hypothetical protein